MEKRTMPPTGSTATKNTTEDLTKDATKATKADGADVAPATKIASGTYHDGPATLPGVIGWQVKIPPSKAKFVPLPNRDEAIAAYKRNEGIINTTHTPEISPAHEAPDADDVPHVDPESLTTTAPKAAKAAETATGGKK